MTITRIEEREGAKGWVNPVMVHLQDNQGTCQHGYGATQMGEVRRDIGKDLKSAVGCLAEVRFGINSQITSITLINRSG
jgi:hypothetical protein